MEGQIKRKILGEILFARKNGKSEYSLIKLLKELGLSDEQIKQLFEIFKED